MVRPFPRCSLCLCGSKAFTKLGKVSGGVGGTSGTVRASQDATDSFQADVPGSYYILNFLLRKRFSLYAFWFSIRKRERLVGELTHG